MQFVDVLLILVGRPYNAKNRTPKSCNLPIISNPYFDNRHNAMVYNNNNNNSPLLLTQFTEIAVLIKLAMNGVGGIWAQNIIPALIIVINPRRYPWLENV